jgi:hypothetical protein
MTQPSRYITDEYLAGLGGIQIEFGDLKVLAHPAQDRGLGLH